MPIITLTTDFGLSDGFAGVLKGVIWAIDPEARIADISHLIPPQDILAGAYTLWRAAPFFPPGTVHLAVVDPGVGGERRPLAMDLGEQYFVGPDNGVFTPLMEKAARNHRKVDYVHLTNPEYWLKNVSHTFHGRDIFAPVAAYLAKGVPLSEFGPVLTDPVRLAMSLPEKTDSGWRAHITTIDVFGNLCTDLPAEAIQGGGGLIFRMGRRKVHGLVDSYAQRPAGELVALLNSWGYVEIAVVNGSAARTLGLQRGDSLEVFFQR